MPGTASARINIDIQAQDIISAGIVAGVIPAKFLQQLDLNTGVSDGQCDLVYAKTESGVAASTITSYDLSGTLVGLNQAVAVFAEVVLIAIRNKRTTVLAYLDVGPHATNGFGRLSSSRGFWPADIAADADQGSIVAPDSWLVLYNKDGVPVVGGTGDILRVTTSGVVGSTNTWDILVIGRSA
jgi:hypothetical protein